VESDFSASIQVYPAEEKIKVGVAAYLLFVNFVAVGIILATCHYTNNMYFDQYLEKFKTVVEVSKGNCGCKVLETVQLLIRQWDHAVVSQACKWCRDRGVRRDAIRLLRAVASQEDVWDSLMIAEIWECMMKLEEEGVEAEHIPEESRVKLKLRSMST
jgi:hypothetical protein